MNWLHSFQEIFTSLSTTAAAGLVKFLGAAIVLIIGGIVARIISRLILKLLQGVNVDKWGDKLKEVDMFAKIDVQLSTVLAKLVYWGIFFVFLIFATSVLDIPALSEAMADVLTIHLPRFLSAAVVFFVGVFVANIIKNFIVSATTAMGIGAGRIIGIIIFYFLVVMFTIVSLNQAGIDTAIMNQNIQLILGAFLLAISLGYGLSARDLMGNMLASFYIKDKLSAGQHIKFSDIEGRIVSKSNTSITLKKSNGNEVVIPLSKLAREEVEIIKSNGKDSNPNPSPEEPDEPSVN